MRWNKEMLCRALAGLVVCTVVGVWIGYTAAQVAHEVGRTVSFGLAAQITSTGIRVNVDHTHKGNRLEVSSGTSSRASPFYRGPHFSFDYPVKVI